LTRPEFPLGSIIAFINGSHINYPQDIDRALLSAQSGKVQIFAIARWIKSGI